MKLVLPDALHARPANLLVRAASRLPCDVFVHKGERRAVARDILQVIRLGAAKGDEIALTAEGEGAAEAIAALASLIERDFDPDLVPENGAGAAPGIAIGHAVLWLEEDEAPSERASDDEELARVRDAFARARVEVHAILDELHLREAQLFEPELSILDSLEPAVIERVQAGHSAEDAVAAEAVRGPSDLIDDARQRLLHALRGTAPRRIPDGREVVLVVSNVTPSVVAALPAHVVGVIATLEDETRLSAGTTSHAAILARGRNLPLAYVPAHVALAVPEDGLVVLDTTGGQAQIWPEPSPALVDDARRRRASLEEARLDAERRARAPLALGTKVRINVSSLHDDVPDAADGVGLLRTELLFADRASVPDEDDQVARYTAIARKTGGPLSVRLYDAGGDKTLRFLPPPPSDPGARGAALLLAHPAILKTQLAAIGRTDGARAFIPLVRGARDVEAVRALSPKGLVLGAMVETPEAAERIDEIARAADFVCIGTNDLACETLGVSREEGPNALDPRVLRHVKRTVDGAHAHGRSVTVCGEIAADPRGARVLVGLGVDALSVAPNKFAQTKLGLSDATMEDCRRAAELALSGGLT